MLGSVAIDQMTTRADVREGEPALEPEDDTGRPYKDTPEVVPSGKRMPVRDPFANTAASKRSTGARQTSRGAADQHQGDTATYDDVTEGKWHEDLEDHTLDEAEAHEDVLDEAFGPDVEQLDR